MSECCSSSDVLHAEFSSEDSKMRKMKAIALTNKKFRYKNETNISEIVANKAAKLNFRAI